MDIRFDGKVAVVTGGSSGIGRAIAKAFIQAGATVVFTGIEDPAEIDMEFYEGAEYVKLDVQDCEAVRLLADHVEQKYGGADILCNNAGILIPRMLHECPVEEWDKVTNVNLRSVFICSKYFLPHMMRKNKGVIVNTSSISGFAADYGLPSYNATKGAVVNLTRSMAIDYAKYNIRVNAVAPGQTKTQMYLRGAAKQGGEAIMDYGMSLSYPMGRCGMPEEIANCVLFLSSDYASYVTGHNLVADGGLTALTGTPYAWDIIRREYAISHPEE